MEDGLKLGWHPDGSAETVVSLGDAWAPGEIRWRPLIPLGDFTHPVCGEFAITPGILQRIMASIAAGYPTSRGIPIDEDGVHTPVPGGEAFGWIGEVQLREDGLWGAINLTDLGREKVNAGRLSFVSPHFTIGEEAGRIDACALTNRPFFYGQAPLQVFAATRLAEGVAPSVEQGTAAADSGGMEPRRRKDMSEQDARKAYAELGFGEVTDEEWAGMIAGVTDFDAWVIEQKALANAVDEAAGEEGVELEGAEQDVESASAPVPVLASTAPAPEAIAALQAEMEALKAEHTKTIAASRRLAAKYVMAEQDAKRTVIEQEIAASTYGDRRPAASAVRVISAAKLDPSAETVGALLAHLAENKGALALYREGETPRVILASSNLSDPDVYLKGTGLDDESIGEIRGLMERGNISAKVAHETWLDGKLKP